MNKEDFLKQIVDTAYNIGFGAKKHFATYDIVEKTPGFIAFFSMSVGIFGLVFECLSARWVSAFFLTAGIVGFYIERYNETKDQYMEKGKELTLLFNALKALYYKVKSSTSNSFEAELNEFDKISARYYEISLSKQILFSDWYTHYKFFWQQQIEWIDEQKHFKFWRDKLPLSFLFFLIIIMIVIIIGGLLLTYEFKKITLIITMT